MTFDEAYHSGCRFRLPKGYSGQWSWPDGFYWGKAEESGYIVIHHIGNKSAKRTKIQIINESDEIKILFDSNDWYLHPEDEHRVNFNNKMEEIINGDI